MQSSNAAFFGAGVARSLNRIMREYREISGEPNPFWSAHPLDVADPYEWHFTIRGPKDSDFQGGLYHGRIILPQNYPLGPPKVIMLTPNGRFEVNKDVCLSASNYHPELWQPIWGLRSLLDALHAFFPTPGEGALHSLDWPGELRKKIAKDSVHYKCLHCGKTNHELMEQASPLQSDDIPKLPWIERKYKSFVVPGDVGESGVEGDGSDDKSVNASNTPPTDVPFPFYKDESQQETTTVCESNSTYESEVSPTSVVNNANNSSVRKKRYCIAVRSTEVVIVIVAACSLAILTDLLRRPPQILIDTISEIL